MKRAKLPNHPLLTRHPMENMPYSEDWDVVLANRAFLGVVTREEMVKERITLFNNVEGSYIIGLVADDALFRVCIRTSGFIWYVKHLSYKSWDNAMAHLIANNAIFPIDRGDTILYRTLRNKLAREAIDCWGIIGSRLLVVKDIRIVIGKFLWITHRNSWV